MMYLEALIDKCKNEARKEGRKEIINQAIEMLRLDGKTDEEILNRLEKFYSDSYSTDELKKFIQETK